MINNKKLEMDSDISSGQDSSMENWASVRDGDADQVHDQHGDREIARTQTMLEKAKQDKAWFIIGGVVLLVILITIIAVAVRSNPPPPPGPSEEHCTYRHPQYPFHGRGACSASCLNANYSKPTFNIEMKHYSASFSAEFLKQYLNAGDIMNATGLSIGHGPYASDEVKPVIDYDVTGIDGSPGIHMTLEYFCCYSPLELLAIDEIVKSWNWPKLNVSFDRVICAVNEDESGEPDRVALMIMLDDESQHELSRWIQLLEHSMRVKGLIVNVPRSDNIGFHVTLARVDQIQFPVNSMVKKINAEIDWSSISMEMFHGEPICGGFPEDQGENLLNLTCFGAKTPLTVLITE